MSQIGSNVMTVPRVGGRAYYGWVVLGVAALAMVGTLPGRTQGLGLITEPLIRDLGLSRVVYAQVNLVATVIGALGGVLPAWSASRKNIVMAMRDR